jgi:FMN reductase
MKERTLVVLSAGLSQPSSTRLLADQLAAATREEAGRLGVRLDTRVVEARDHAHDVTNHVLTGFPSPRLGEVIETVLGADGLIAVTPIFNASYSGLFKSFVDVLPDDSLVDKPVLVAATGGTARHSLALEHALRPLFTYLRALVVPTSVFAASEDWAGADGARGTLRRRIERAGRELAYQMSVREPAAPPDPFALPASFEDLLAGGPPAAP